MGMITRVRGRLHSITKIDPQMKDEKIAETDLVAIALFPLLILLEILFNIFCRLEVWENVYLQYTTMHTILNQLLFFTMSDLLFCNHEDKNHHGLTGLNSLLFYYVITFFVTRIIDIAKNFNAPSSNPQNSSPPLLWCIIKIIIEYLKAIIIIICLREQGLQPHPNVIYTIVTWSYYMCTEKVYVDLFPKLLELFKFQKLEGLETLYAPVILQIYSIVISCILAVLLFRNDYMRLSCVIFYQTILLKFKDTKKKSWKILSDEKQILESFRPATKEEIREWNDICAICLQPLEKARVTRCSHLFHAECLRRCYKNSTQCPLCKSEMNLPEENEELEEDS